MKLSRADLIKVKEIAEENNLSVEDVKQIIHSPYGFIKSKSKEIEFEDDMSKEEFMKKKTNFNIPSIGKLYASNFLYNEIQKKKKKN